MTNDHKRLADLYHLYLSKNLSDAEHQEFLTYVQNPAYTNFLEELISDAYEHPKSLDSLSNEAKNRIFEEIVGSQKNTIGSHINTTAGNHENAIFASHKNAIVDNHENTIGNSTNTIVGNQAKPRTFPIWMRYAAAVLLISTLGTGLFYYNFSNKTPYSDQLANENDIEPGRSGATLTLSNGKKIRLSDLQNGEVANEAGVKISKPENGEVTYEISSSAGEAGKLNTLSTENSETYKLRLPDGSYVWLNSASSLTYSSTLIEKGKRTVRLQGEAYFEIAKDKKHPFVVMTSRQNVDVLGTHFNINSYPDEATEKTTLIEGSLRVSSGKINQLIKPGEQAVNQGNSIKISTVNAESVIDWKNGDFNLDDLDFRVAMRKIARWYNVEIIYDASVPENIKAGGWISRNRTLSAVLKHIESSGQAHFRIAGKKVYVTK